MIGVRGWLANRRWEGRRRSISESGVVSVNIGRPGEKRVPAQVAFTLFRRVSNCREGKDDFRI